MSDLVLDEMLGLRNPRDIAEIERLKQQVRDNIDGEMAALDEKDAEIERLQAVVDAAEHLQATTWNDMKSMDAAQDDLWDALAALKEST